MCSIASEVYPLMVRANPAFCLPHRRFLQYLYILSCAQHLFLFFPFFFFPLSLSQEIFMDPGLDSKLKLESKSFVDKGILMQVEDR